MARKREIGLHADVAVTGLAGALFGNIASAVFVVLGVTAARALGMTPMVFIVAGVIFLFTLLTYIEGIAAMPQAGGSSGFARRAFNELVSFLAGWALILDYLIIVAIAAFFGSHYLAAMPGLGVIAQSPWDVVCSVLLIAGAGLVNVRNVTIGASISVVVSLATLASQLVLAIVGLALVFDADLLARTVELGVSPTWHQLAFALPIAMIGFTGLEVAANLSGELRDPGNELPRPMIYAATVSVVMFVVMSVLALMTQPVRGTGTNAYTPLGQAGEGGYVDRPLVGIIEGLGMPSGVESLLHVYISLLALAVLFLTANTGIAGLSRLVYSMSLHRQLPSALSRINREAGTPVLAVLTLCGLSAGLLVLAETLRSSALVLAQLYAFGAMLSFVIANASVIRLRFTEPDLVRPFLSPLSIRVRGVQVSLVSVFGLVTALALWLLVIATHPAARALGIMWMMLGFVAYGTYRLSHGQTLRQRYDPRVTATVQYAGPQYQRVLLAVRPERGKLWGAGDAELASLAAKLLDGPRPELAVMLVHELPLTKSLTAPLGDIEQVTTERLGLLRAVTDRLQLRLTSSVTRARAAGRAICQEAARRDSDAVVLATRIKPRASDKVFGKTVEYVLRHAPCDVLVLTFPLEALRPRGGAAVSDPSPPSAKR